MRALKVGYQWHLLPGADRPGLTTPQPPCVGLGRTSVTTGPSLTGWHDHYQVARGACIVRGRTARSTASSRPPTRTSQVLDHAAFVRSHHTPVLRHPGAAHSAADLITPTFTRSL
jgi:hypothetical protein